MLWAMALAHFVLDAQPGNQSLTVNGEPVPGVVQVQLLAREDEMPQLLIVQRGTLLAEGDGIVRVQPEAASAKEYLLAWLAALDPEQLEQQALDSQGWGSAGLAKEILAELGKLAEAIE